MHRTFIVGIIAGFGSFMLVFEATGAESPGPDFSTLPRDSRNPSSSREVTLRFRDGSSVRVAGKLAALITEGSSAARSKQYERAISLFTAALQSNPDTSIAARLHFDRGLAYSRTGNTDKAISDYTAAIQLNPKYMSAYYSRAIQYSTKRNYKLALRDDNMTIQLNPKYANAYHNRGVDYAQIGEFGQAIADYSKAIQLNPRSASTFDNRARAYEHIEKTDKAIADYDQVIRTAPKDAEDYTARGSACSAKGNYKAAISSFEKALQLSPKNDAALGGLAWLRATCPDASLRNSKEAIRMSMRACELSKWREEDHIQALAAAYAEIGDFD